MEGEDVRERVRRISEVLDALARAPESSPCDPGLRPGQVVGRFELLREIGRGGFGVVFEARDRRLGRVVAFKALRATSRRRDPEREEFLRREAEAIAHLQHSNIVTLFDSGRAEGRPYLILELLHGEPLSARLARGRLPVAEAVRVAIAVTRALVHAHRAGVFHRDLKPGNVFLCHDGTVKVLDFGLAHVFATGGPSGAGTPGYMAPEQTRGEPEDARTDVYAVGVLLREMVTGEHPRGGGGGGATPRGGELAAVPASVRAVVRRATHATPALRFHDAAELLEALDALQRERPPPEARRTIRAWLVAAVAVAVTVAGGAWWSASRAGAQRVVVADFENQTDDPDLDGISGMLITSLEQSRKVAPLTRTRAMDLLRQHALGTASRLDAAAARDVARAADAPVLLLGSVRREGGTLAIELRAVRPRDGSEVFAPLRESATHAADIPAALDRLSRAVRSSLGEGEPEVRSSEVRIGNALTQDLEAYRHYFLGLQCAARPVYGQDCGVEFRRAVERDPAFGAAQYQVALWYEGDRVALRRALEYADQRAPAKEALFIRALAAHVDGKEDDALALYGTITSRWPDEKRAWFETGDILRHRDRFEAAIPWFERAIELDPDYGWALGHLVEVLGVAGHTDDLRTWTDRWERRGSPAALHALSHAYGWLGDTRAARDAARRAALLGAGLLAMEDLLAAKVYVEEYDDAERDSEILARPESDVRPLGFYALAAIAMYEGRPRAGLARLDALTAAVPGIDRVDRDYHVLRADYLLGMGDSGAVWREVEAERAIDPRLAAEHAAGLAWLGDMTHAADLARDLRPGSVQAALFDAVAAYRRGEERKGLEQLRAIAARAPLSVWRLGAIFLYADLAAAAGRDAEAVAAVRTFHRLYMPRLMWRSWAYPRSLVLLARSSERLGRNADACAALDRLAVSWERADPEQPLVAESRALRSRLCHAAR